jgi:hypothetical protein
MKRPTLAEQGQTWSMSRLLETKVGRKAESRLKQKEDYNRDAPSLVQIYVRRFLLGWHQLNENRKRQGTQ